MTDLQLGLLVIGAAVVVGVYAFNRVQESRTQRAAERAFGTGRADVLLDEVSRREPTPVKAHAPPALAMPDERVDYIIVLRAPVGMPSAAALEPWRAIESRFGKRALLAGSEGSGWRRLLAGDLGSCTVLRASLQMLSRAGVISDAELIEFRSEVETMATRIGASVAAPEMRTALEGARSLDRACAEVDVQVALHVVGGGAAGAEFSDKPFQVAVHEGAVTLTLDVGRTLDPGRSFEAMARAGRQLAGAEGRLVDDNGNTLDERALASIGTRLESVCAILAERGIEPGSPLALRLFS